MSEPRFVYLDWAATAPLCEEAAAAMAPYLVPGLENLALGGNANALYDAGRAAFAALEDARASLARDVGASRPDEITFTSGATEADNMALFGLVEAAAERARQKGRKEFVPHVVTTEIEHDAVLVTGYELRRRGVEVTFVKPDAQGRITPAALSGALRENTVLASVCWANNEIGTVQDIPALARVAHDAGALFHTDAVQALGKVPVDVRAAGVDAASFSAHKVGGPKGVGALYLKARTPFHALVYGGGQESGRRSGTQNVCGAAGFAAAAHAACAAQAAEAARLVPLRDALYAGLSAHGRVTPAVSVPSGSTEFAPHVVMVCVDGFESETLILRLSQAGFAVSGGSACATRDLEPSHVLKALGIPRDRALGALRISLGRLTTERDISEFLAAFSACIGE